MKIQILLPEPHLLCETTLVNPNDISAAIVDASYHVHREIGPGLFESVYELVLTDTLQSKGLKVVRQMPISIRIRDKVYDEGFRADMLVENSVIVEIKSVEQLARVHKKQMLTYLRLSGIHIGLLINFGGDLLKGNIERLVVNAPDLKDKPATREDVEV
jgi:GxxExxY protein